MFTDFVTKKLTQARNWQMSLMTFTLMIALLPAHVHARNNPGTIQSILASDSSRADKTYASLGLTLTEFRSVELVRLEAINTNQGVVGGDFFDFNFPLTGQPYAMVATLGTYITDYFKTELRYGQGVHSDTLKDTLNINMKYYLNWYIGGTIPVTDYMGAYAMYGLSHYAADVTRSVTTAVKVNDDRPGTTTSQVIASRSTPEDKLFGTSFSTTWLLGLDFKITNDWYLAFEYGRLVRDTESGIRVYQATSALRYEF